MNKSKIILLTFVLLLGIGFAAMTRYIYVTGNFNITSDIQNFSNNLTFADMVADTGLNYKISDDGLTLYIDTVLTELNESKSITYKIKNNSTVDAYFKDVNCSANETAYVGVSYVNNIKYDDLIPANGGVSTNSNKITVSYTMSSLDPNENSSYNLNFICKLDISPYNDATNPNS